MYVGLYVVVLHEVLCCVVLHCWVVVFSFVVLCCCVVLDCTLVEVWSDCTFGGM